MGAKRQTGYDEWRAMEEKYEGDIEEEGRDEIKEEASWSMAPGPVPRKGPTVVPEVEGKRSRDDGAPETKERKESKTTTERSKTRQHKTKTVKAMADKSD